MRRLLLLLPAGAMAGLLCSCGDKSPVSQGKMADLIVDMQLAEAYAGNHIEYASDSARNVLRQSVLAKYGMTQAEMDTAISWYAHHLEKYDKLYEEVERKLERKQKKLLASSGEGEQSEEGSLWPYSMMAMLSPNSAQDAVMFSLPVSDIQPGERLTWKMRLSKGSGADMTLGVDYREGGTSYINRYFSQSQRLELNLQTDSSRNVSRVYGVMRVDAHTVLPIWADSISLTRLPLAAETYHTYLQQADYRGPAKRVSADSTKASPTVKPITDRPVGRPGEGAETRPGPRPESRPKASPQARPQARPQVNMSSR